MRKLKHIGDYLVVKFNAREMEEWGTTLGEYGVIDKELYTGNLDVDKGVLEFDGIESLEEAIEQAKSLAFPEEPEQTTTPPAPSRPHFPQIGEVLPSGYKVLSAYCVGEDRYVLAQCEQAPDPFVVWSIDEDGDTHTGRYFGALERARKKFAELCLDWQELEGWNPDDPIWGRDDLEKAYRGIIESLYEKYGRPPQNLQIDHADSETPEAAFARKLGSTLEKRFQNTRTKRREEAVLTPEIEAVIDKIPDVHTLQDFLHFWWMRMRGSSKGYFAERDMQWALEGMRINFLKDKMIL